MGGSHQQLRAFDDDDQGSPEHALPRGIHLARARGPTPGQRGRPTLLDDLHWAALCHAIIERHAAYPTHSWAALARGRGIHPRTLYNWRQAYEWLQRHQPDRLRRAISRGTR